MPDVAETLVAGSWQGASDSIEVRNPTDVSDLVARVPALAPEDVSRAVAAADAAWREWHAAGAIARGEVLARAADIMRGRRDSLADVLVREAGKLRTDAETEVVKSADFLDYYAGFGRAPFGDVLPDARDGTFTFARRVPVGVVAAITPWNDPLLTPARKLGPALVAGNAVLLKPATNTPLVAIEFGRVLDDAGLPPGVVSVLTGHGRGLSAPILDAPAVRAVTFTGSTSTGAQIRRALAGRNVGIQTEMGGKNAAVVMPDADLDHAAGVAAAGAFAQAGQRCTATSRVIVHDEVADEVIDRLAAAAADLAVGPASDPDATMGPLISRSHLDDVAGHVRGAVDEGATVLTGGDVLRDAPLDAGCFFAPTVLGVKPDMRIWHDEVFGPVLAISRAASLDDAVDLANDSTYGLSASIFTRDLDAAFAFSERVETGQVAVNQPTAGWDVHLPFGGFKDSGSAFKEQGAAALEFYTRWQTVAIGRA